MKVFLLSILLIQAALFGEGFVAGTLIKTSNEYETIESLHGGDIISCSCKRGIIHDREIVAIQAQPLSYFIELIIDDEIIGVAADHQFYVQHKQAWVKAEDLKPGDFLLCEGNKIVCIDGIRVKYHNVTVYNLSIKHHHTFFVSRKNIVVHNFSVPVFIWIFGEGIKWGPALMAAGCGLFKGFIEWSYGKNRHYNQLVDYYPEDETSILITRGLTNKEAQKQAEKWGYKKTKEFKFNSHGKPKFIKGNSIITPDADGHNGGVWKEFDRKGNRIGTLDKNGNYIKD